MTPTPPNTAKRIKAWYTGPFGEHVMLFHARTGTSDEDFVTSVAAVVDKLIELQYDNTTWDRIELAQPGSPLFFPYGSWTPIIADNAAGVASTSDPSRYLNFAGRGGTDGVRARLFLFETYITGDQQMRLQAAENVNVEGVVNELNDETSRIGTISGSIPVWKEYANIGSNDFLTKKARNT